jgi:hypothetical protein
MTKTVYTCIVNNYDDLKEPINKPPSSHKGWKFICYTDNPNVKIINPLEEQVKETIWEIRPLVEEKETPAKTARWHKINFHKFIETEESLWVDATFFINQDLNRWWRKGANFEFTAIKHPFDNCAYKDIQSCIGAGKGDMFRLMDQALHYKKCGLPENYGLIASGILARKNTKECADFCYHWWQQIELYTERDQPCFSYSHWAHPFGKKINFINWNYTERDEFIHVPHLYKQRQRNERFKKIRNR